MTAAAKAKRTLRLGAFMRPVSIHTGAWRYPDAYPDANFNFGHIKRFAQRLKPQFDAFMADHLAVLNMPMNVETQRHSNLVRTDDAFAGAGCGRERLGLSRQAQPHTKSRSTWRAALPRSIISAVVARVGMSTTSNPHASLNFGIEEQMEHDERYRRAREFYDVVTGLGTAGPTTLSSAMSRAASISIRPDCILWNMKASIFLCAAR